MDALLIGKSLAVFFLGIGAFFDLLKDREVPDALVYGFFTAFLVLSLISLFEHRAFGALALAIVVFFLSYLLFWSGALGEGEAYFLFPTAFFLANGPFSFVLILLGAVLLSSVFAVVVILYEGKRHLSLVKWHILLSAVLASLVPLLLMPSFLAVVFSLSILIFGTLSSLKEVYMRTRTVRVPLSKAVGETLPSGTVITPSLAEKLKRKGEKTVVIVKHIPFLPGLFLSSLLWLLFPQLHLLFIL